MSMFAMNTSRFPKDVDLAFITIHGTFGEDGQLQQILEERGVAYTGDGVEASRAAFDKILSKEKFREHSVVTPEWEVVEVGQRPTISVPLVVKPARQGSTVGVVIVKNASELDSAMAEAGKLRSQIVDRKICVGPRKLTIGVLGDQALPILEIIPKGGFYDFNNKYPFLNPQGGGGAEHVCPAKIDPKSRRNKFRNRRCMRFARSAWLFTVVSMCCLPDSGEPFVLEVNTIPGMTEASLAARSRCGCRYQLCRSLRADHRAFSPERKGAGR